MSFKFTLIGIDLLLLGCNDAGGMMRCLKDLFTIELKDMPVWHQFCFHVRQYPIDPFNFPFQVRSLRRIRRAKTKVLIFTKELASMIKEDPENMNHISHMMERGHLVAMNEDGNEADFQNLLNSKSNSSK